MVLKKKLFEEFQDDCLMNAWPSLISECNDLSNSGFPFCLDASNQVSAQEDVWFGRRFCLKYWNLLPWWHNAMILLAVSLQSPVQCPTNIATALYKYADVFFFTFEQLSNVTLPHSVFQTYTWRNISILIGIIPHDTTLKHYFVDK